MKVLKRGAVLLLGELPEIERAYNVSRTEQDLSHDCNDRIVIAASKWGVRMGDNGCFRCRLQVGLMMLFLMVETTIQRCVVIDGWIGE